MNQTESRSEARSPSLGRRALAALVVLVAAWILLHFLIHIAVAIASVVVVVAAIVGIFWALKTLL
jgi:hypothetical protein